MDRFISLILSVVLFSMSTQVLFKSADVGTFTVLLILTLMSVVWFCWTIINWRKRGNEDHLK